MHHCDKGDCLNLSDGQKTSFRAFHFYHDVRLSLFIPGTLPGVAVGYAFAKV